MNLNMKNSINDFAVDRKNDICYYQDLDNQVKTENRNAIAM